MIIKFEDLKELREKLKDKKIVFCSGCFDMVHIGHADFFKKCKEKGDILVVSVGGDKIIKNLKGETRPILSEKIRIRTIDSLKPVDYCFIDDVLNSDNLQYSLELAFEELRPDVYVINEEVLNLDYRKNLCNKFGISLVILRQEDYPDFCDISATKIIEKIKSLK